VSGYHDPEHVEPECRECGAPLDAGCPCEARDAIVRHAVATWGWDPAAWPTEDERRAWLAAECAEEGITFLFEPFENEVATLAAERAREALDDLDEEEAARAACVLEGMGLPVDGRWLDWSFGEDERRRVA
jgi:hypothetical protein